MFYNIPKRYRAPRAHKPNKGIRKEEEHPVLANKKKGERRNEALFYKTKKKIGKKKILYEVDSLTSPPPIPVRF